MHPATTAVLGLGAAGCAALAYAAGWEVRAFRLRRVTVPVLPTGQPPLRLLHLSDLHLTPGQRRKQEWVRRLRTLHADAVVVTGDFIAHRDAVPVLLDALDPLLDRPGFFVLGSNDYYEPRLYNPGRYLAGPSRLDENLLPTLPWPDLVAGLTAAGWCHLGNARTRAEVAGRLVDVRGVDDPHIERDDYAAVAGPADPAADLVLGISHAPYRRILDAMAADDAGLILAGHTHGGQLCLPGFGALVTNCDLDRRRASGLSRHARPFAPGVPGRDRPGLGGADGRGAFLHVSAGLGTSPFAPVRFACPPEATLLTLTALPDIG